VRIHAHTVHNAIAMQDDLEDACWRIGCAPPDTDVQSEQPTQLSHLARPPALASDRYPHRSGTGTTDGGIVTPVWSDIHTSCHTHTLPCPACHRNRQRRDLRHLQQMTKTAVDSVNGSILSVCGHGASIMARGTPLAPVHQHRSFATAAAYGVWNITSAFH